jgi:crotonobetainyl-CoA:carnitine CoA-transferase CaiB-like acyl-CoA transferase
MDELSLDWETLRGVNPRLVSCSISGFGQSGELSEMPAIEWSVQAASGMTAAYVDPVADPLRLGLSVLDPFTGYVAFAKILAALRERDATGLGQRLDVAMLDAAFTLMWPQVVETLASPAGEARPRLGRRGTMARFRTRDSTLFIAALHQRWFEALCEEIGAPGIAADARFVDADARARVPDELHAELARRLEGLSGRDLEPRLGARGIPAAVVRSLDEAAALPQAVERGLVVRARERGPDLGAHTAEVLAELAGEGS